MLDNKVSFEKLLHDYKKQKVIYEQSEKIYKKAYSLWENGIDVNGDLSKKAIAFGVKLDKATHDMETARRAYDCLAHLCLNAYCAAERDKDDKRGNKTLAI